VIKFYVACDWNEVSLSGPNGGYFTHLLLTDDGVQWQNQHNIDPKSIWQVTTEKIQIGETCVTVCQKMPKKSAKLVEVNEKFYSFRLLYAQYLIDRKNS